MLLYGYGEIYFCHLRNLKKNYKLTITNIQQQICMNIYDHGADYRRNAAAERMRPIVWK